MAKSNPSPKSNFLQTAIFMIVIYLGMVLLFQSRSGGGELVYEVGGAKKVLSTSSQILDAMREADLKLMDIDLGTKLHPALTRVVDADLKAKKIDEAEANRLHIEGAVLTADAQLRAGIQWKESSRFRSAYQTLVGLNTRMADKPEWTEEFELPRRANDSRWEYSTASGKSLYERSVETLSASNKQDLIWGFIPGGYAAIDALIKMTGSQPGFSYAFAAFLLALVVRAIVFPLSQKQLMFGRQMSQLTPLANEIRAKYKDNPTEMNQRVMELYREYGINPMAGCGPALLQLPLFLTVYQAMLLYQFEFTKGTFLWVNPTTSLATKGLVAPNLGHLDYILIVIYGVSMVVTTLLTPVSDPTQVRQQRMIGIGISVFFTITMFFGVFPVPAAFVLYWIFTNLLATVQSLRAYRLPLPPLEKVNAPGGGVYPKPAGSKWMQKLDELQKQAESSKRGETGGAPLKGQIIDPGEHRTGTPAKHKPKKRK